jgi:hypothetical protein
VEVFGAGMEAKKTDGASAAAAALTAKDTDPGPDRAGVMQGTLPADAAVAEAGGLARHWMRGARVASESHPMQARRREPGVREGVCVCLSAVKRSVCVGLAAARDVCASDRRAVRVCVVQIYTYGC